jgi:hypothetical protein
VCSYNVEGTGSFYLSDHRLQKSRRLLKKSVDFSSPHFSRGAIKEFNHCLLWARRSNIWVGRE